MSRSCFSYERQNASWLSLSLIGFVNHIDEFLEQHKSDAKSSEYSALQGGSNTSGINPFFKKRYSYLDVIVHLHDALHLLSKPVNRMLVCYLETITLNSSSGIFYSGES